MAKKPEAAFTDQVVDLAHLHGWKVAHFHAVMIRPGQWVTPVQADGKGFPDLVLVRDRVIFAELKVTTKPTKEQAEWLGLLAMAGAETYVWTPKQLEEIERTLR